MKLLISWLRDYVDPPAAPAELASALARVGFEVASIDERGASDAVIDLEITANRPDCLNVLGLAREMAAIHGVPLRDPVPSAAGVPVGPRGRLHEVEVVIEDVERCPRYALALADVRVGPSPSWMVDRLSALGLRAINNVVDVTNYVLAETGQPMHAFDLARLGGSQLRIRLARPGERLTTLDGTDRTLTGDMLVIADATRPQAIGGVMGGADSEVTVATRVVAIESAYFQPSSVRRTSKRLGLSTEASYRFERGADPDLPARALARMCRLLQEIGAGVPRDGILDCIGLERTERRVELRAARVGRLLGIPVPDEASERILTRLGFGVERRGAGRWSVVVPGWRGDVTREVDLIEEVARHHGYERLPDSFPPMTAKPPAPARRLERDAAVRRLATAAGFSECVTFAFVARAAAERFAEATDLMPIANPLSELFAVLRPSLLPGVLDSVGHNRRRGRRDVRLFEAGSRFRTGAGETRGVALAWTGAAAPEHWSGSGRAVDFYDIKGLVELFSRRLGIEASFLPASRPWLVAGRSAAIRLGAPVEDAARVEFGVIGQLDPAAADAHGIPPQEPVFVAELDLDAIDAYVDLGVNVVVTPLPRHPAVVRDLAILVPADLPAATVRDTIRRAGPSSLVGVREFDRYQGKGIPEGSVSLAVRLTFQEADRTLTDAEVQQAIDAIVAALGAAHGARLR